MNLYNIKGQQFSLGGKSRPTPILKYFLNEYTPNCLRRVFEIFNKTYNILEKLFML